MPNKTKKSSEDDKIKIRNRAKEEVVRLEKIFEDEGKRGILDAFKNRFNICETAYKIILKDYNKYKNQSTDDYLKLDMRQIPSALKFAGYTFDKQLLTNLFGAKMPDNKRTAKKLRNAATHGVDEKAAEEIIKRKDELFGYMNEFLDVIKNFNE